MANKQQKNRWARLGGMVIEFDGFDRIGRKVYNVWHAGNLFAKKCQARSLATRPTMAQLSQCF